jgi:phosphoglycolate phosphatase
MKRLILFDIDGTLLHTHGAPRRAFHRALLEVYGTAGPIDSLEFDGKTDPQIARELLTHAGLETAEIDRGLDRLFDAYLRELDLEFALPEHRTTVLPGVADLLMALESRAADALVGLLTGNILEGARRKLESCGLADRFAFGAYGSDSEHRPELPAIALERARALTGRSFSGRHTVIIGDTPHDITCGRALGVRAAGVCTGRHDRAALAAAGADIVLGDLSDTGAVIDWLLGATNGR